MKELLADFSVEEIKECLGLPTFKAKQIFKWLSKGYDFSQMSDQQKPLREFLDENYYARGAEIIKQLVSKDGTEKFLFGLADGNVVEGVLMKYGYGNTLCISTQVGCRMGCEFCASTLNGLVRNLSPGEMLGEVVAANSLVSNKQSKTRGVTNVVLMGSGEPLDNYLNVVKFLRLLNDPDGLNISLRNVSLSTCGLVPEILKLADEALPINLTVSLHSPFQHKRKKIMPVSNAFPVAGVIEAAKFYFARTKRRVYFEYTLLEGQNDSAEDADELARLLKGFPAHVNLIRLNPIRERKHLKGTGEAVVAKFIAELESRGISVTQRRRMGIDIEGACGQLRQGYLEEKNI